MDHPYEKVRPKNKPVDSQNEDNTLLSEMVTFYP